MLRQFFPSVCKLLGRSGLVRLEAVVDPLESPRCHHSGREYLPRKLRHLATHSSAELVRGMPTRETGLRTR